MSFFSPGSSESSQEETSGEVTALEVSAMTKYEAGNVREAISELTEAIKAYPDHPPFYYLRGNAREDVQNWSGAQSDYDEYLERQPRQHNGWFRKGLCYQQNEKFEDAVECYDKSEQLYSRQETDFDEILEEMDKDRRSYFVIEKEQILNNRANAKINLGNIQGGLRDAEKAIEVNPDYSKAYITKGLAALQNGHKRKAQQSLESAAELGNVQAKAILTQL